MRHLRLVAFLAVAGLAWVSFMGLAGSLLLLNTAGMLFYGIGLMLFGSLAKKMFG